MGIPLEHLLTARISLLLANRVTYAPGSVQPEGVVATDRLILLVSGSLRYTMESRQQPMGAGDLWLVPAWTRRSWQAHGDGPCELAWVEFVMHPLPPAGLSAIHLPQASRDLTHSLEKTITLAHEPEHRRQLLAEMTFKHLLASVLMEGEDALQTPAMPAEDLSRAIALLREHLHRPDALHRMFDQVALSASRLRARFRETLGLGPADYLQQLRMQQARYLLLTTDRSVKEIAGQVGYEDPLYFSRRYRQYWRRPPMEDRAPNP